MAVTNQPGQQRPLLFHVLVAAVNEPTFNQASVEFAREFNMVLTVAAQILNSPPIVFLTDLTKSDLDAIRVKLIKLSHPSLGIEFLVTTKLSATIPRVMWPNPPHFLKSATGEVIRYVDFQWRGNAFACPNCAETFVFRRMGNPFVRFQKAKQEKATGQGSVPAPLPPARSVGSDPAVSEPASVAVGDSDENVMELQPMADDVEIPIEEAPVNEDGVMELAPIAEPDEIGSEGVPEPIDILETLDEVEPSVSTDPTAPTAEEPMELNADDLVDAPLVEETVVAEANCSVFLSNIAQKDKKEKAAKVISEVKGISLAEAKKLVNRVLVPVLKNAPEEQARNCLEQFKKIGVAGRITRKK